MLESAEQARKRADLAAAALRLVNEAAAAPLIAAADRGQTSVLLPIEAIDIPVAARLSGRLYDDVLIDALEHAGEAHLARACRIFAALGFSLSATPEVEREEDIDRVSDVVRRLRIAQIELGFATAQEGGRGTQAQLLQAVALPAAHLWRARADSARLLEQHERKALAVISEHAERGADSCRLAWRELSSAALNSEHLQRLAAALRGRGFRVEIIDAGSTLRLHW
jgi:hypothetical protein